MLTVADRRVPLVYQTNKRARRIILRFDHGEGRIVVVLPRRATLEQGRRFALLNKGWIRDRLDLLPEPVPFRAGRSIPLLGVMHRIRHRPQARGLVWQEDGEIHVAGRPEHLSRRVEDWLRREARREMDWVVVRNRVQHTDARNQRRIDQALTELSKRVGFRVAHGLSERVIYRELFPSGLTLLDKGQLGELGTSHLVARQELRALVASLNLPMPGRVAPAASEAA